jgi:HEAT repeat protein
VDGERKGDFSMSDAFPGIIKSMNDKREGMRNFAIAKAVEQGEAIIPTLINKLGIKEGYVQDSASAALIGMGAIAIPFLIEALNSDDRTTRWAAAAALGQMGPEGTEAVDKCRKLSGVLSAQN